MRNGILAALAFGALALSASATLAATQTFTATLNGASETPPNATSGTGTAVATFDTVSHALTWKVAYSGLTGPATAAHFHGPAAPGVAAGVEVPLTGDLTSPIQGSAVLTAPQITDLEGGLWYVNVHTAQHPKGEIRGQMVLAH